MKGPFIFKKMVLLYEALNMCQPNQAALIFQKLVPPKTRKEHTLLPAVILLLAKITGILNFLPAIKSLCPYTYAGRL